MNNNKLIVSHAPFWHDGDSLFQMNLNIMVAALPAVIAGLIHFGAIAFGVIALSVSSAMAWEAIANLISRKKLSIGDLESAVIGLIFGMMLSPLTPWWVVIVGTFIAVVIGKMIFGGSGANPFNPVLVGMAILTLSWKSFLDFDAVLMYFDLNFIEVQLTPLVAVKNGFASASDFALIDLLMGREIGSIGGTFGLGIIIGGLYLIARGYIRWEIVVSFILGIIIPALIFRFFYSDAAGPMFHLFSGYTLLGAFFLATENSSSPVNTIPMLIYGFCCGAMIILMRNLGIYPDGTVLAILLFNLVNPILDNIRPKALGKGVTNA